MQDLFGFIMMGFALTGSPGPATLGLAAAGAAFGARKSLGFMFGIVTGVTCVMAITASGIIGLVLGWPGAVPVVATLAAAYMLYLAWRIATAPPLSESAGEGTAPSYAGGLFLALANPKAYAAMAALFSGFVLLEGQPLYDAFAKGAVLVCTILIVNPIWLNVGAALTRLFRSPRANRVINVSFAVLLVISVVSAVLV
jgi:threonine/homoserine/homoserine lactone efflux protein